ncbi:MAG TPA: hypothetical protein VF587_02380 [Solirubrobacteraceae bacterium]|jgi:hypothetical protein
MSTTPGPPPGGDPNYPPQQPHGVPPQGPPGGAYPPQQPTQSYPQQGYGGGSHSSGGGGGGTDVADFARRHIRTPETKEFFKSSEFAVWLLTIIGVMIAGLSADDIEPSLVWILITILSFSYIISRGIAKSGTKHHDHH